MRTDDFSRVKPEYITRIYVKKQSSITQGLGADFNNVLSLLHLYEMGLCAGVETDYKKTGNYYDCRYGENWWNYYFEPLCVGNPTGSSICEHKSFANGALSTLVATREENFELIQKYIRIKPSILAKVDDFVQKFFTKPFALGVFHRGTDKHIDATEMSYDEVGDRVEAMLNLLSFPRSDTAIFVTSDEARFIPYMEKRFGPILYLKDKFRAIDATPIHFGSSNCYQSGEDALLDCLIFSKTDLMMRMDSNLSQMATFFSPKTPEILMNTSYYTTTPEKIARFQILKQKAQLGYNINPLVNCDPLLY